MTAAHDPVIARPGHRRRHPQPVAVIDLGDGVQLRFIVSTRPAQRSVRLQLFQRTPSGYQPTTRKMEIPAHLIGACQQKLNEARLALTAPARARVAAKVHTLQEHTS